MNDSNICNNMDNVDLPYGRFYNVEIHQGDEVVRVRIPITSFETFAQLFLIDHVNDGTYLYVTGMCLFDFNKYCFI